MRILELNVKTANETALHGRSVRIGVGFVGLTLLGFGIAMALASDFWFGPASSIYAEYRPTRYVSGGIIAMIVAVLFQVFRRKYVKALSQNFQKAGFDLNKRIPQDRLASLVILGTGPMYLGGATLSFYYLT